MNTPVRIASFLLGLGALFSVALGVGNVAGPDPEDVEPASHDDSHGGGDHTTGGHRGDHRPSDAVPGGLQVSQDGYTFHLPRPIVTPGNRSIAFHVLGPDGQPVTAYDLQHEKQLHLIAVRRDLSGFQHVHPTLADDGTWRAQLDLTAGTWRLFADFKATGGDPLTLGADLQVAGALERPVDAPHESRRDRVDGYLVTLDGDITAGEDAELTVTITHNGREIRPEPYLGAQGHLVALREGDLAYLHVHPEGDVFHTSLPSDGRYRFFLDFKHDGVVRTAEFTVDTTPDSDAGHPNDHGHDH